MVKNDGSKYNVNINNITVYFSLHPHEQVGMVYTSKAKLKIVDEEGKVLKGDFTAFPPMFLTAIIAIGNEPS